MEPFWAIFSRISSFELSFARIFLISWTVAIIASILSIVDIACHYGKPCPLLQIYLFDGYGEANILCTLNDSRIYAYHFAGKVQQGTA